MAKERIELLSPAGSMANLKAAIAKGADAVYLGMKQFSARDSATNFDDKHLRLAVALCKANNVKLYLTMNTLVKNHELYSFFEQLSYAYSEGIDAVILQEISFIDIIKKQFPDLRVHISTQAGAMNSGYARLLPDADRITLARELTQQEIENIRENISCELEVFCHGALCVSISGQCLFSSFLGGRSGNRGKCAQPCRKQYNGNYYLSTRELCLVNEIPDIIKTGVNSLKIEGRMRTPSYVAITTSIYRKAIDSYYDGSFHVSPADLKLLNETFTREFTKGWFKESKDIINARFSDAKTINTNELYSVRSEAYNCKRNSVDVKLPNIIESRHSDKQLLVRVYSKKDAVAAAENGADVVYIDMFDKDFLGIKQSISCKLFAVIPRLLFDKDIETVKQRLDEIKPGGVLLGNIGMLSELSGYTIHLDYNANVFNDMDVQFMNSKGAMPIISPELSIRELMQPNNKDCAVLVHGKIRLMTLRHHLKEGDLSDSKGTFQVNKTYNGTEILNDKELGLLSKASSLVRSGFSRLYIDTDKDVSDIVSLYRKLLDGKSVNDKHLKRNYVLGWAYRGIY